MSRRWLALVLGVVSLYFATGASALEQEFRYAPDRFRLVERDGITEVWVSGASHETVAGRPDLPWLNEMIEIPAGMLVTALEVMEAETEPLSGRARIASAIHPTPGLGPFERTTPDPEFFGRPGFQPVTPVRLGYQGWQRDRHLAILQICPVRWDAVSGRLERVVRIRVRLGLEPGFDAPLPRLRVVPEWEASPRSTGVPRARGEQLSDPGRPQPFRATQIPSLLGSPVAYVIVTNDAMAGEFQRLADWKTQTGVPAVVRTLSFIRSQYVGGSDDAERIRSFVRDAYSRWGTQWVLLGGDTEVLPTRYAYTTYYGGESIACDMYFSCLDGNWNADGDDIFGEAWPTLTEVGDDVDLLPEVWVGRAPVTTVDEARRFVDRSIRYVRNPVSDYQNRLLLFAEVLFPQNWNPGDFIALDGAELAEDILPSLRSNPGIRYARLYENYADTLWEPGAIRETRQTVIDSLNRGYNIAVHIGHGYRNVMSCGDANLTNADVLALTNGDRLINLYSNNCTSNAIDFPSIGEAFLLAKNGGAVTNVGSSRFDFPVFGRHYQEEYFRLLYKDSVTAVGEAQARQKLPFVGSSKLDGGDRWTQFTLLLLGDPELRVYTGIPRVLSVTHAASISLADSSFTVQVKTGGMPLPGARVVAYKPGDEYRIGYTNASGNVVLPFRADSVGTFELTVTGFDCRPYQSTVLLTPAALPVLADQVPIIDDDSDIVSPGGIYGDGNGLLDAGETVDIRIAVRNNGGSTATNVVGTLSTTDPIATLLVSSVSYGTIAPGALASPAGGFRLTLPATAPDQREIPFRLRLVDGAGRAVTETFPLTIHSPDLLHRAHVVVEVMGNGNGRVEAGETITYLVRFRNLGTGSARQVTAKLRNHDGMASVLDSTASWGDLAAGQEGEGDALTFVALSTNARLELRVRDLYGELFVRTLDLIPPAAPPGLVGSGFGRSVRLSWTPSSAPDLRGYYIYRSTSPGGPFQQVNLIPTGRTAYYLDEGLAPLTRYYYQVVAVDSSANASARSASTEVSTSPPYHALFPIPMGRSTPSSVAVDHLYPGYQMDIVAGADVLYVWHPDGSAPVDADGSGATNGDFTTLGDYYAAGPSISDLDGDGVKEIIAPTWNSRKIYVFDLAGQLKPGWPAATAREVWSSAAIGDLDNDGTKEIVVGSNGRELYVFRANGSEWRDGDNNPATVGVFKTLGAEFNFGTAALADLNGDHLLDIVYGSFDGRLYAWRSNGTNLPGFPVVLPGPITASVAVGYLDGPGDTELDLVVPTGHQGSGVALDSLYAFRANGQRRAGWPVAVPTGKIGRTPSPALADMNNDGFLDVVFASTNGGVYVYNRNGQIVPPFNNVRFSVLTVGATESSPVVADIDADGRNDIVVGDDNGVLTAIGGTGVVLAGFPIVLEAEVKGTPALCDCDGDGLTEIVVAGWDRKLHVWDFDFPFSPSQSPPWPQFHHDAERTGNATRLAFVSADDPRPARPVVGLELTPPGPNPARVRTRFTYAVPTDRIGEPLELAVYDLSGRRVRVIERDAARPGRRTAEWDLGDERGMPVHAGLYLLRIRVGAETRSHKLLVVR